jgi:hypothetical protein
MPDPLSLSAGQAFARAALLEVTPEETIGAPVGEVDEGGGLTTYRFETTMAGYPNWNWSATIAHLPDAEPTIVETELLPADGALLAPEWIPWSERMEDYRAAQLALGEAAALEADDDSDDDDDDEEDEDDDDFGSDVLHSGDLDGVDIDELDVPPVGVDEADEAEPEPDGAAEEPPAVPARRQRARKQQQDDQGD